MNPFFLDKPADIGPLSGIGGDVQVHKTNDLNLEVTNVTPAIVEMVSYHKVMVFISNGTQMLFHSFTKGPIGLAYVLGVTPSASYEVNQIVALTIDPNGCMVGSKGLMA